ncbi:hypothetical protein DFQ27_009409 [Actinomortierella ambigua]|uniref:Uncharacterized protein n=1 Tax=Actinomortierella ambigua TaxID=1343610 RepID=A0A9P6PPU5_9FUNG|nr:hypothetical protein DFQ27_009409 [Actinomortierella ambigua]
MATNFTPEQTNEEKFDAVNSNNLTSDKKDPTSQECNESKDSEHHIGEGSNDDEEEEGQDEEEGEGEDVEDEESEDEEKDEDEQEEEDEDKEEEEDEDDKRKQKGKGKKDDNEETEGHLGEGSDDEEREGHLGEGSDYEENEGHLGEGSDDEEEEEEDKDDKTKQKGKGKQDENNAKGDDELYQDRLFDNIDNVEDVFFQHAKTHNFSIQTKRYEIRRGRKHRLLQLSRNSPDLIDDIVKEMDVLNKRMEKNLKKRKHA